jgi:murein DD-endopeptidase MepM/ murein hydrolase activator NlpD
MNKIIKICKPHFVSIIVQVLIILFFINYFSKDLSHSNIENQLNKIDANLSKIDRKVNTLASNDSIMNIQLLHYPATQPISLSSITNITSIYGNRTNPITGEKEYHVGIDYSAIKGTLVFATADGIVDEADKNNGYGNIVKINHLNGYISSYAHLNTILTSKYSNVKRGDIIGTVGNSGTSTGNHLHYEISYNQKKINPRIFYKV